MNTINQIQDSIIDEFSMFEDWLDRYSLIIDMGQQLPEPSATLLDDKNLIDGCQSKVWIDAEMHDGLVHYTAFSDALLIKGIVAMLLRVLNDRTPEDILTSDLYLIDRIGLHQHLSPNRSNGLSAMLRQMRDYAKVFQAKQMAE